MPDGSKTARRVYSAMLRLLPADMRRRFGREMQEVMMVRLAAARGSVVGLAAVWLRAAVDVALQAAALRLDERDEGVWKTSSLWQDIRYGMRSALARPGFAVVAIVTLGLGIGASTATFSVVQAVILRDLPFQEPDRLVFVWPEVNANKAMTLLAGERMPSLESISGLGGWLLTLTGAGEPREVAALKVAPEYFELLGVRPVLGRSFLPGEDLPGEAGVVVLSHDLWVNAYGADPTVVDRVIALGGADYDRRRVVGVMSPGVDAFWKDVDVWIPLEGDRALGVAEDDTWFVNDRIARLAPGATLEQANAEVKEYAAEVARALPRRFSAEEVSSASVQPAGPYLTRSVSGAVWAALWAVGLVLVIGCFNVTNLLLARGESRERELAVRVALGAGRARMTRMLLAEASVLGFAGGALGIVAALGLVRLIVSLAPESFPGIDSVGVDAGVLGFALVVTLLSTLGAGLIPALRLGRAGATGMLGGGARGAGAATTGRLTPFLLGSQIALAVVVTIGSGLMVRSLTTLLAVDPGMDGSGVLAFRPSPPAGRYPDGQSFFDYYDRALARVAEIPGVTSVGAIHLLPGTSDNWNFPTFPEGFEVPEGGQTPVANFRAVRGDYFQTTRVPLVEGRYVDDSDRADTEPVIVVNEAFAQRFWPDQEALGKRVAFLSRTGVRHRVVGVVGDVHQHGRELAPEPEMYLSHGQVAWNQMGMWIVARVASGEPLALAREAQQAVWSIDPDVPISDIVDLAESLGQSTRTTRFLTALLGAFGALALALSAVGVFGVASYTSGRRRPEFGVRLALGSTRSLVVRSAVGKSLAPVAVGLVVGLVGAALSARLLTSVLFGVEPLDPPTFAGVATLLAGVGVIASVIPAWRASRVDPATVLGGE